LLVTKNQTKQNGFEGLSTIIWLQLCHTVFTCYYCYTCTYLITLIFIIPL